RGLVVDDEAGAVDGEEPVGLAGVPVGRVVDDDFGGFVGGGEALEPAVEPVEHLVDHGGFGGDAVEAGAAFGADDLGDPVGGGALAGEGVFLACLVGAGAEAGGGEASLGAAE